jgi:ribosomal protein L37AE/L43A
MIVDIVCHIGLVYTQSNCSSSDINNLSMECPKCKQPSLKRIETVLICQDFDCRHIELQPLCYAPDFVASKDDDQPINPMTLYRDY